MKKLNLNLLKALIETDFALGFSSKNLYKSKFGVYSATSSYNDSNTLLSLDLQELIKSLKQVLRLLQFVESKKRNQILVCSINKQHLDLLNSEFDDLKKKEKISVKNKLTNIKVVGDMCQFLLLLEEPLRNNKRIFKKLFEDKLYLVNKVNSKIELNNWGTYKINNDLDDFKKLIFLIILLKQALN